MSDPSFTSASDEACVRLVSELEEYVFRAGVILNPSCELAKWFAVVKQMPAVTKSGSLPTGLDSRDFYSTTLCATALASAVLRARGTSAEQEVHRKLGSLGSAVPLPLPSPKSHRARNTVLEIIVASALAEFAHDVRMTEPDVTGTIVPGVGCIGVACKVVYGGIDALLSEIRRAAKQIRAGVVSGRINKGVVLIDVTNLLPHEELLEVHPARRDVSTTFVDHTGAARAVRLALERALAPLRYRFKGLDGTPSSPVAVVCIAWTTVRVESVPTFIRTTATLEGPSLSSEELAMLESLRGGLRVSV